MTTALEGVSGQQHAPAALYPRERPDTHFTGGWDVLRCTARFVTTDITKLLHIEYNFLFFADTLPHSFM